MTREEFIRKWLGNQDKQYTEQFRDEMRDDLDSVIDYATSLKNLNLHSVNGSVGCTYWVTSHLRYAKKQIRIDEQTAKYELRLQQMWQGSDGSQKWEWVEVVE